MGAWGAGTFENDSALDWVAELEKTSDLELIRSTFADTFEEEYLDADEGTCALAAAEVVAAMAGHPGTIPDGVKAWIDRVDVELTPTDIALALRSAERVRAHDSELVELWSESGGPDEFLDVLHELEARLHAAGA